VLIHGALASGSQAVWGACKARASWIVGETVVGITRQFVMRCFGVDKLGLIGLGDAID
jgi:hypothetical protein